MCNFFFKFQQKFIFTPKIAFNFYFILNFFCDHTTTTGLYRFSTQCVKKCISRKILNFSCSNHLNIFFFSLFPSERIICDENPSESKLKLNQIICEINIKTQRQAATHKKNERGFINLFE